MLKIVVRIDDKKKEKLTNWDTYIYLSIKCLMYKLLFAFNLI